MVMYKGGMVVKRGMYWNPLDGQRVTVREDGKLPGDEGKNYLKISPAGLLVIAPLFGMMYTMFLPLYGIGAFIISCLVSLIGTLAAVTMTVLRIWARIAGRNVFFNSNPLSAYFITVRKKERRICTYTRRERDLLYAYLA